MKKTQIKNAAHLARLLSKADLKIHTVFHREFAGRDEAGKPTYASRDKGIRRVSAVRSAFVEVETLRDNGDIIHSRLDFPKASETIVNSDGSVSLRFEPGGEVYCTISIPEDQSLLTLVEKKAAVIAAGYVVKDRDPRMNRSFAGKYMVADASYADDLTQLGLDGQDDASTGICCIVGDSLPQLIEQAYASFVEAEITAPHA